MTNMETQAQSTSVSMCTVLLGIFVTLKLCGVIDWSWWWVLAPLWLPIAIVSAILLVVCIVTVAFGLVAALLNR